MLLHGRHTLRPPLREGVYRLGLKELGLNIVVLPELRRVRDTLPLRLLARGETLREAVEELRSLPPEAWEKLPLQRFLAKTRVLPQGLPEERTAEEKEMIMILEKTFEEFEQAAIQKGPGAGH